jgi:hypothetical protein
VSARALLSEATAAGIVLRVESDRLRWRADAPPAPALLARLREHKAEIAALLSSESAGATVSSVITRGVRAILRAEGARGIPPQHWPRVQRDVRSLMAGGHTGHALHLGWDLVDLFGCDRSAPWHRLDQMGLALLLGDCEVAALQASGADLRTASGSILRFPRRPARTPVPALIWDLVLDREPPSRRATGAPATDESTPRSVQPGYGGGLPRRPPPPRQSR